VGKTAYCSHGNHVNHYPSKKLYDQRHIKTWINIGDVFERWNCLKAQKEVFRFLLSILQVNNVPVALPQCVKLSTHMSVESGGEGVWETTLSSILKCRVPQG